MHGGRASNAGISGGGGASKKTKNCDREHEEHEALVKHYQVGMTDTESKRCNNLLSWIIFNI